MLSTVVVAVTFITHSNQFGVEYFSLNLPIAPMEKCCVILLIPLARRRFRVVFCFRAILRLPFITLSNGDNLSQLKQREKVLAIQSVTSYMQPALLLAINKI